MPIVKLYAGLRKTVGENQIDIPSHTLRGLLDALLAKFPALEQVWDGTRLRPHIVITINGHIVNQEKGLDIPVAPDDHIAIFPPIAGG